MKTLKPKTIKIEAFGNRWIKKSGLINNGKQILGNKFLETNIFFSWCSSREVQNHSQKKNKFFIGLIGKDRKSEYSKSKVYSDTLKTPKKY